MLFGREQYHVLCCSITFHYLDLQAAEPALESETKGLWLSLRFNPFLHKHRVQFCWWSLTLTQEGDWISTCFLLEVQVWEDGTYDLIHN